MCVCHLAKEVSDGCFDYLFTNKHEMVMIVQEAYTHFKTEIRSIRIGLTSFSETNRRTCLCTLCSNMALKIVAIKRFAAAKDQLKQLEYVTKQHLSMASLCKYESKFSMLDCMERNCNHCK